jgi:hypothetical protein
MGHWEEAEGAREKIFPQFSLLPAPPPYLPIIPLISPTFYYIPLAPLTIKRLNKPSDQPVSRKTADEDTSM